MSKPVEVEFLMKDKLTPGMNKAEREALELRNTVRLENIKSLDPLLYSHLTHQKYIRIK